MSKLEDERLLDTEELEKLKDLLNENSDLIPRLDKIVDLLLSELEKSQIKLDASLADSIVNWKADYLALKVKCHMFNQGHSLH